jgi:hypothetical protein
MALTTYSELQTSVANWLNRSDLSAVIPDFITMAEKRLDKDPRLRQIGARSFVAVENYALPTDFRSIVSLYHDGTSVYAPIMVVSPDELANRKGSGAVGVPRYAAVITDTSPPTLRFAPDVSGNYTLKMTYERTIEALSGTNPSNTLLTDAPEIYLYAALSEAEGYLQEDQRVALWEQKLDNALRQYRINADRKAYGGKLVGRPKRIIGEKV